jgi:hypothetical protein
MIRPRSIVLACSGLAAAVAFCGVRHVDGARAAEQEPKSGDVLKLDAKKEKAAPIPNFAKAYGAPFESLQTVGNRLADARQKSDPIAIALVAIELGLGEKVSGKKAEVTSEEVQKEAVELAVMRQIEPELTVMALIAKDEGTAAKLTGLAKTAARAEADRIEKFKSGERERGIHELTVRNLTPVGVSVRINGIHLGWVHGNSQAMFNTSQFYEPHEIFLSAHDQFGDVYKSHALTGHHHFWTWVISDNW